MYIIVKEKYQVKMSKNAKKWQKINYGKHLISLYGRHVVVSGVKKETLLVQDSAFTLLLRDWSNEGVGRRQSAVG